MQAFVAKHGSETGGLRDWEEAGTIDNECENYAWMDLEAS